MILQYFKKKENKEQIIATKQYKQIICESNIFLNDNNFFITKDYKTSFEIVSIFLIMFIRINLLQYNRKKYLKVKIPSVNKSNIKDLINVVLDDLEKTKFINDKFYSNSKAKSLIQRGSSINKIRSYLFSKGVKDKYIKTTIDEIIDNNEDQDFFSAIKVCKKKRIGPARDENNRPLFFKKDIGILARSGFDFETSKRVMDLEKNEYLKIINLL